MTILSRLVVALLAVTVAPAAQAERPRVELVQVASTAGKPGVAAAPVQLRGWFSKPNATAQVPAVLLLHGCSGPGRNLPQWRQVLDGLGMAVLSLDSFSGRDVKEICSDFSRVSDGERQVDAFAGLDWLAARPEIDASRIAVMGFSHGGGIALDVASLRLATTRLASSPTFKAVIAFYPACRLSRRLAADHVRPVLILIGEADDWTPASSCRELKERSRGIPVELEVFAGAAHGFDVRGLPTALRPNVQNRNSPTGRGATTGGDPAALAAAESSVKDFLQRHF